MNFEANVWSLVIGRRSVIILSCPSAILKLSKYRCLLTAILCTPDVCSIMKDFNRAIIRLSWFLIVLLEAFVAGSNDLFSIIRESNIKPLRIDKEIINIQTVIDCMIACRSTANCVGGRIAFEKFRCQIMIHSSGIMSYRDGSSGKDLVFGIPCSSSNGYDTQTQMYISGHNDKVISGIMDIAACQKECSQLAWCMSADTNHDGCFLAGVHRKHITLRSTSDVDVISSSKKCLE